MRTRPCGQSLRRPCSPEPGAAGLSGAPTWTTLTPVIEVGVVVGVVAVLVAAGAAAATLTWQVLLVSGVVFVAVGTLVGIPTGVYYHVVLHRFLKLQGQVPRDWWLHPTRYHSRLEPWQMREMRPWFGLGAIGFGIMMLGCLIAALGVMVA